MWLVSGVVIGQGQKILTWGGSIFSYPGWVGLGQPFFFCIGSKKISSVWVTKYSQKGASLLFAASQKYAWVG